MRNDDKSGKEIADEISVREETDWIWGKKGREGRGGGASQNDTDKRRASKLQIWYSGFYIHKCLPTSFFFCVADDVI
jgi:hypothetical protein